MDLLVSDCREAIENFFVHNKEIIERNKVYSIEIDGALLRIQPKGKSHKFYISIKSEKEYQLFVSNVGESSIVLKPTLLISQTECFDSIEQYKSEIVAIIEYLKNTKLSN